jgi:glycerate kinase
MLKKCIVIPDSFKGTLTSTQVCSIMVASIQARFPHCHTIALPIADGGEGTVDCFVHAGAQRVTAQAHGPFGETVTCEYARMGDTAVVEMAQAAGMALAGPRPNPARATTYGVGELIRHAVEHGCRKVVLGLGGSCTNDAGAGMAAALGARFYDAAGRVFVPSGATLHNVRHIDCTALHTLLNGCEISAICDVNCPMYGETGAAFVFGPQKGADSAMIRQLDDGLRAFAAVLHRETGTDPSLLPGAGAAGGMGAGVAALLGGSLKSGIEAVLALTNFDQLLPGADFVFTGEGRLDAQSRQGKAVSGVAAHAKQQGVPVIAVVGGYEEVMPSFYEEGLTAVFSISPRPEPYDQAKLHAKDYLRTTMDNLLRLAAAIKT